MLIPISSVLLRPPMMNRGWYQPNPWRMRLEVQFFSGNIISKLRSQASSGITFPQRTQPEPAQSLNISEEELRKAASRQDEPWKLALLKVASEELTRSAAMTYYFFPNARVDSSESSGDRVVLKVFYDKDWKPVIEPEVKIYNEDWEELSLQPLLLALEMIQEEILESEEDLALVYEWSQDIEKKLSGRLETS